MKRIRYPCFSSLLFYPISDQGKSKGNPIIIITVRKNEKLNWKNKAYSNEYESCKVIQSKPPNPTKTLIMSKQKLPKEKQLKIKILTEKED